MKKQSGYRYCLPSITNFLDKLNRCQTSRPRFGLRLSPDRNAEDIFKTVFNIGKDLYTWCRIAFGLKNTPATCRTVMENILRELQNEKQ